MKKLKNNAFVGNTSTSVNEIDLRDSVITDPYSSVCDYQKKRKKEKKNIEKRLWSQTELSLRDGSLSL